MEEKKLALAQSVYNNLCTAIDNRKWVYEKDEENLVVHFKVSGDDLPMQLILFIDVDRQLIRLISPMPYNMSEDKRIDGALATGAANYGMVDGNFDYDISDGSINFRMTASFDDSLIGEGLFQYMISCACSTIDRYNDKFLAIDKGILSVTDFIASE